MNHNPFHSFLIHSYLYFFSFSPLCRRKKFPVIYSSVTFLPCLTRDSKWHEIFRDVWLTNTFLTHDAFHSRKRTFIFHPPDPSPINRYVRLFLLFYSSKFSWMDFLKIKNKNHFIVRLHDFKLVLFKSINHSQRLVGNFSGSFLVADFLWATILTHPRNRVLERRSHLLRRYNINQIPYSHLENLHRRR